MADKKPTLSLIGGNGRAPNDDEVVALVAHLIGRPPTPEEVTEVSEILRGADGVAELALRVTQNK